MIERVDGGSAPKPALARLMIHRAIAANFLSSFVAVKAAQQL
jgi:hypothetical protein